jgi:GT2 family glycosyltransferase
MSNKFTVSVVIPNYNGKELLKKNIPHVLNAKKNKGNQILEIIVVDDCSTDTSVKFLKRKYSDICLVRHKKHRGVSAAINTGARSAKGKFVVLLNNDVVPERDFLVKALHHFSDESVFSVSFNEKGYSWAKGEFVRGFVNHSPGKQSKKVQPTFWANGGSAIVRRNYWMKLGGMDEALFSPFYWEDIDICYRAQKRGWKVLWEPGCQVLHEHESTVKTFPVKYRQKIQERNQLLFIWKNITSPNLFRKHLTALFRRILRHPGYIKVVFAALLKIKSVIRLRKKEKKECRVSDETIFDRFSDQH